jgi:two-component system, sensor histidine kinase and response regulator
MPTIRHLSAFGYCGACARAEYVQKSGREDEMKLRAPDSLPPVESWPRPEEPSVQFTSQLARLNSAVALERLGGDEELLREVAQLFLEEYPTLMTQIRAAVSAGDPEALQRAAHSLKGSVSNFGADAAYHAAFALELMGRNREMGQAQSGLTALEEALEYIHPALAELAAQAQ